MDVRLSRILPAALLATGTLGCVGILGLDHGIPEDPDGSDHASAPDGATSSENSSGGNAPAPDAADDRAVDDVLASDTTDAKATPEPEGGSDATPGPDAACRAPLQPCQHNTDCCSGTCGVGLTCL
jgi:hypothetical protein